MGYARLHLGIGRWLICLVLAMLPMWAVVAAEAASQRQDDERTYPSVDGGVVRCFPNFWDSPTGATLRERLLTAGPKVDIQALLAAEASRAPAEAAERAKRMADQHVRDWAYRCRYRGDNAAIVDSGRFPRVVFMGDSITENWPAADPAFFGSAYVGRGISGQTSSQMVGRFYSDVVPLRPRVVHILAGTNDINGVMSPVTQQDVVDNVRAMADIARANHIAVVIGSVLPMAISAQKPGFEPDRSVTALNRALRSLAQRRHLVFVDYYAALQDGHGRMRDELTNDGIHPNRAGYARMEPLTRRAILSAERGHQ